MGFKFLNQLSKISIRGRFAIAIVCMKRAFREVNLHQTYEAHLIAKKMATPLISDELSIWEIEMKAYIETNWFKNAEEVIDYLQNINNNFKNVNKVDDRQGKYKNLHLEVLDKEFYQLLIEFYANMSDETKEIIYLCESVASSNLYCGYCEKSSIEPLVMLLDKMDMWGKFDFEKIAKNHPFSHDDKWGKPFYFEKFIKN